MFVPSNKEAKERYVGAYKEEKRKVKRCMYQSKEEVQEQFGRKMNQGVNEYMKLFLKGVNNAKRRKGGEWQQNKGYKWEVETRRG